MSQKRTQTSISGFFPKSATKIPKISSNENQPENDEKSEKERSENTEERERSENNEESLENSKEKNSFTMDRFVIKKPKMSISAVAGPSNLDNSVPNTQENEILAVENSSESVEPKRKSAKKLPKTKFSNTKFKNITRPKIAENVHTEEQKKNNATANKNCKFTGFSFTFGLL